VRDRLQPSWEDYTRHFDFINKSYEFDSIVQDAEERKKRGEPPNNHYLYVSAFHRLGDREVARLTVMAVPEKTSRTETLQMEISRSRVRPSQSFEQQQKNSGRSD